jgi:hypothetical protein
MGLLIYNGLQNPPSHPKRVALLSLLLLEDDSHALACGLSFKMKHENCRNPEMTKWLKVFNQTTQNRGKSPMFIISRMQ